jgi:hypothetical protein
VTLKHVNFRKNLVSELTLLMRKSKAEVKSNRGSKVSHHFDLFVNPQSHLYHYKGNSIRTAERGLRDLSWRRGGF